MRRTLRLHIQGMTCDDCARHVTQALQSVPGVEKVHIPGWRAAQAEIVLAQAVPLQRLIAAVRAAGYDASASDAPTLRPATPPRFSAIAGGESDLVVVGGGSGGFAAAIRAAEMGARVLIINQGTLGGTCVNIGCIPSKALLRSAAAWHHSSHHPFAGVHTRAERLDWDAVRAQKDALVASLRQEKYTDVLAAYPQISLLRGQARFTEDGGLEVNGQRIQAKRVVIASGARPRIMPWPGVEAAAPLTSTSLMALETLPESLIVLGGRAVALELGQMMARFGVRVTLLQRSERILPTHEPEVSTALTEALREEGLEIITGVQVLQLGREGNARTVRARVNGQPRTFRAAHILMALGRQPNTDALGLANVGVAMTAQGNIIVDKHMATSNPHIYAAGDCTTLPQFVYVAAAGGSIAAENALNGNRRFLDLRALPQVVFTEPQAARVGLTEAEALAAGHAVKTSVLPLEAVPRARAARDTRGLIKLVAHAESGQILGAHLLAAEGGEVIQTATLAVKLGLRVQDLQNTFFPYLTQVEGLKLAALAFDKDIARLSCCAG